MTLRPALLLLAAMPLLAVENDIGEFQGHRYQVVAFEPGTVSWQQAVTACVERGGYLACIETEAEQEFLAKLLGEDRYAFLGASDTEEEGEFRWINGAPFDYTNWHPGQPNNYGGEEHYLATYDWAEWVDVAAQGDDFWMPVAYVIEWDATDD
jgi:hypothetical protein